MVLVYVIYTGNSKVKHIPNRAVKLSVASKNSLVDTALPCSLSSGTSVYDRFTWSKNVVPGAIVGAAILSLFGLISSIEERIVGIAREGARMWRWHVDAWWGGFLLRFNFSNYNPKLQPLIHCSTCHLFIYCTTMLIIAKLHVILKDRRTITSYTIHILSGLPTLSFG